MDIPRKPLAGILPGGGGNNDDIFDRFDATEAADDFGSLPKGVYVALAVAGRIDKARTGTDCYKVEFRVIEGQYVGRRLWWDKYFTSAAMPYTKRDLAKLGIDSKAKLLQPFPANRFVRKLTVTLRRDDDGIEKNEIKNLEVLRVQEPTADPFAPSDGTGSADTVGDNNANGGEAVKHPDYPFGFRVVGPVSETRRLVDLAAAFTAHCATDPRARPDSECYLSAFAYGDEFRAHLTQRGTPKGYTGPCGSPYLWLDVDHTDLAAALAGARRLAGFALFYYSEFRDDDLLLFFSGRRGFHIGVPLTHGPAPSAEFNAVCRRLAERLAAEAGVTIDTSIYDKVHLLRAPNSTHPKTGLHKRRLTLDELMRLSVDRITDLAREPLAFEVSDVTVVPPLLAADWTEAEAAARERHTERAVRPDSGSRLQRDTLVFIREGADEGQRHARLFRAAGDLRGHGAPAELVHALLTEAALDSGLSPSEVARTMDCGIANSDAKAQGGAA